MHPNSKLAALSLAVMTLTYSAGAFASDQPPQSLGGVEGDVKVLVKPSGDLSFYFIPTKQKPKLSFIWTATDLPYKFGGKVASALQAGSIKEVQILASKGVTFQNLFSDARHYEVSNSKGETVAIFPEAEKQKWQKIVQENVGLRVQAVKGIVFKSTVPIESTNVQTFEDFKSALEKGGVKAKAVFEKGSLVNLASDEDGHALIAFNGTTAPIWEKALPSDPRIKSYTVPIGYESFAPEEVASNGALDVIPIPRAEFLREFGKKMLSSAKDLACGQSVVPDEISVSASLSAGIGIIVEGSGQIQFSAKWDTSKICN
ncbi:MAG: hypothetical protein CMF68_12275 [Magnetovibrio sp.]|nr:hypothetical protein [Magnetovibrio sp.]|tara:strand:- start:1012 stop:1959 length:948 start_codon:yes stop_codon:yes gene_type:complete